MKRRLLARSAALILGGTVLAVLGYNLWSWCCGRCTVATFLTPGPFGLLLLGLNALAALALLQLVARRRARLARWRCRCGMQAAAEWRFCPVCGTPLSGGAS